MRRDAPPAGHPAPTGGRTDDGRATAQLVGALVVVLLVLLGALLAGRDTGESLPAGTARVVDVVDGDTVVLDLAGTRETTRLLGIDTPEVHHPTRPVECWGAEASARLAELTPPGTLVRVERDEEARDHYDRMLAYLFVTTADGDEVFVNEQLVADGAAVTLPIDPNDAYRHELASAEGAARGEGRGLWGTCGGPGVPLDPLSGR